MSYKITDICISCGDCMVVCGKNAIDDGYVTKPENVRKQQGTGISSPFRIIASKCDECGACVEVCPCGAIVKE